MNPPISFRDLHRPDHILVLINAWDAASARLIERAGAEAIATTSAGFAWANGYPDGDIIPKRVVLDGVAAITRVTNLPVTVDLESGYSDDASEVADLVHSLVVSAGISGINIEDGHAPPSLLEAKIQSIRRAANQSGSEFFINARTDVYLDRLVPEDKMLAETLQRLHCYQAAGCDGFFVPAAIDPAHIERIVKATVLPINVLAVPGLPGMEQLKQLGVRRLSVGSAVALHAFSTAQQLAARILKAGATDDLHAADRLKYADMNELMRQH